jgi:hypothetical protein
MVESLYPLALLPMVWPVEKFAAALGQREPDPQQRKRTKSGRIVTFCCLDFAFSPAFWDGF